MSLRNKVGRRLEAWGGDHQELAGQLLEYGSAILQTRCGDIGQVLSEQIRYQARRKGLSEEELLEHLFLAETADTFMFRLQM